MSIGCMALFLPEFCQLADAPGLSGVDAHRGFSSLSHTLSDLCLCGMGHHEVPVITQGDEFVEHLNSVIPFVRRRLH